MTTSIKAKHRCRNPANQKCRISNRTISIIWKTTKGIQHVCGKFDYDESLRAKNNLIPEKIKQEVIMIIRENYHDFGPTFAAEKLLEVHKTSFRKRNNS